MPETGNTAMTEPIVPDVPEQPKPAAPEVIQLPDDHPLVKTLAAQKEQLRAARAEVAANAEKAKRFDQIEEANKTEIEKAQARADAAEKELASSRIEALRSSVALQRGLTPTQAKRLVGSTLEELQADADELLADLNASKPAAAPSSEGQGKQGEPVGQSKQLTENDLESMTDEQIVQAKAEGRLNDYLGIKS